MPKISDFLDTKEASSLSGFSEVYIRKLAQRGTIKAQKVRRDWLVSRASLQEYLAKERKVGRRHLDK